MVAPRLQFLGSAVTSQFKTGIPTDQLTEPGPLWVLPVLAKEWLPSTLDTAAADSGPESSPTSGITAMVGRRRSWGSRVQTDHGEHHSVLLELHPQSLTCLCSP
jgi:hypothetical protein